jgi:hypothetical protein
MAKIDVSYTAKPDPQGRRLFLDTKTGLREWEQLPDYAAPAAAGKDDPIIPANATFGMSIDAEKKFEGEAKPTKPVKHRRHKANEGDK